MEYPPWIQPLKCLQKHFHSLSCDAATVLLDAGNLWECRWKEGGEAVRCSYGICHIPGVAGGWNSFPSPSKEITIPVNSCVSSFLKGPSAMHVSVNSKGLSSAPSSQCLPNQYPSPWLMQPGAQLKENPTGTGMSGGFGGTSIVPPGPSLQVPAGWAGRINMI